MVFIEHVPRLGEAFYAVCPLPNCLVWGWDLPVCIFWEPVGALLVGYLFSVPSGLLPRAGTVVPVLFLQSGKSVSFWSSWFLRAWIQSRPSCVFVIILSCSSNLSASKGDLRMPFSHYLSNKGSIKDSIYPLFMFHLSASFTSYLWMLPLCLK